MANWVHIRDNQIQGYYDLLPTNWENISGLNKSQNDLLFLKSLGWFPVIRQPVDYNSATHDISRFQYEIQADQVIEIPVVTPIPGKEVSVSDGPSFEDLKAKFMTQLRAARNQRLAACDYTQLADMQSTMDDATKAQWVVYRQALRDFPAKYQDNDVLNVENVVWPEV